MTKRAAEHARTGPGAGPIEGDARGPVLDLEDVSKVFRGGNTAVEDLTLRLTPGVVGLLGPNGAGKSTLMRVMATVTRPTSGRVLLDGVDIATRPRAMRAVLGYLPQDFGVYPRLTSREFLGYLAAAKGLPARAARARIDELLALVNLTAAVKRPLGGYSGGMLRRIGIAQALLADPRVLIADEPTAGLDPEERARFRNLLTELSRDRIVVLSTHIVSDVESVATDLAVVSAGRLLRHGPPDALLQEAAGQVWEAVVSADTAAGLQAHHRVSRMVRTGDGVRVRLVSRDCPLPEAVGVPPDLEDLYLLVVPPSRTSAVASQGVFGGPSR
ncbi:ABC-type multidrug transport system ATPase subunit [Nocardiopsis sp. Huas11]|uniref:ABC transporter ATP-binding protein n=1 Tax=Nocardiopsis sp. Huas11 TaxID=2183912 RepID=UPI000EADD170|nr:ABC transporter ATP-binding protein [Nocardiopsis sp. Huas11]RKS05654.1 ABC-type multidrug transport system ATPase subunit [Nocardiopsis sp. Huas11]